MLKKGEREVWLPKDIALERSPREVAPFGCMPAQIFETDHLDEKRI
jgi:hypothetical protein